MRAGAVESSPHSEGAAEPLIDPFGRRIDYLRLSVTDRCDLRCVYCVSSDMAFLPRSEVLSLEELEMLSRRLVHLGIRKIRVTGGEPLVRRDVLTLLRRLGRMPGLEELVMTTNGALLPRYAAALREAGVQRLNISLDTLDPERYRRITRNGRLERVLEGIEAARQCGFERIRLNVIAMRGRNDDEIPALVGYAAERGLDIGFIEEMPLGAIDGHDRGEAFMAAEEVQARVASAFTLEAAPPRRLGGPARELRIAGRDTRVGFIAPHTGCFCDTCNRLRLTVDGLLLPCLGREQGTDLRGLLRGGPEPDPASLDQHIREAVAARPRSHGLDAAAVAQPQVMRFMSSTGG